MQRLEGCNRMDRDDNVAETLRYISVFGRNQAETQLTSKKRGGTALRVYRTISRVDDGIVQ